MVGLRGWLSSWLTDPMISVLLCKIKSLDKLVSHYTKLRVLYSYLLSVFEPKGIV